MSAYIFLIILFCFVYYDAKILRTRDEESYQKYLRSSPMNWAICSVLFFAVSVPVYLYRRIQLKKLRAQQGTFALDPMDQLSDALGVVVAWLMGVFFTMVGVFFLSSHLTFLKNKLGEILLSTVVEDFLMVFLIFLVTRKYPSGGFWETVGFPKRKISFFKVLVIPGVIGLVLAYLATLERAQGYPPISTPLSQLLENSSSLSLLIFIGSAVLIAPFIEEIIFRGYLYGILTALKGKLFAVVCVALVFALMHVWQYWGDWIAILAVTVLGFVLSFLRAVSGLTLASIMTHYVYNGFSIIFPILFLIQTNAAYFEYQSKYNQLSDQTKEALLKKSIQQQPSWHPAYNDLAWLYTQKKKNLNEALSLVEQALKLAPEHDAYLDTKAEVLFRMKRFSEAIKIEEKLISENPDEKIYTKQLKKYKEGLFQEQAKRALRYGYI